MVEFMTGYMGSMDRPFDERPIAAAEKTDIEDPIIPIGEIGTTSIDFGQGNILQNLERNINMGTKKIQIVFSGRGASGISSGPSSYGKDVRAAVREKAKSTGVELVGVELSPSIINGLAGFDQQNGRMSEEKRQQDLNKVRDAIRFAADVSGGGCVDLWSQEFQRNVVDAKWNKGQDGKPLFFDYSQQELQKDGIQQANIVKYLINDRNGDHIRESVVRTGDKIQELKFQTAADRGIAGQRDRRGKVLKADDYVDAEGNYVNFYDKDASGRLVPFIDPKTKQFVSKTADWNEMEQRRQRYNEHNGTKLTTEEYIYRQKLLNQKSGYSGQALYWGTNVDIMQKGMQDIFKLRDVATEIERRADKEGQAQWVKDVLLPELQREEGSLPLSEREALLKMRPSEVAEQIMLRRQNAIKSRQEQAMSYRMAEAEIDETLQHIVTPDQYAKGKAFDSYADMGIEAMRVTRERKLERPVYIGPEIGWAGESYGGHPQEFKELIQRSREEMIKKLTQQQGYTKEDAKEAAKTHIKGMLDTSHLAMWYKHFARKDNESDEKHLKRFNEWAKDQVKDLVKAGVVGGVQVVDSITGEHSHLPAGQGVFDVAGLVKTMKEEGFNGPIIAEGHEEDTAGFGNGRILTETWRAFGAPIGNVVSGQPGGLRTWGGIQSSYFGHTMPTNYIVGAYVPSNEWALWSETPFE